MSTRKSAPHSSVASRAARSTCDDSPIATRAPFLPAEMRCQSLRIVAASANSSGTGARIAPMRGCRGLARNAASMGTLCMLAREWSDKGFVLKFTEIASRVQKSARRRRKSSREHSVRSSTAYAYRTSLGARSLLSRDCTRARLASILRQPASTRPHSSPLLHAAPCALTTRSDELRARTSPAAFHSP